MNAAARIGVLGLFALGVGAGDVSRAAGLDGAPSRSPVSDIERLRRAAHMDEEAVRSRLGAIASETRIAEARLRARGRAYVELARVGLLPVGAGFEALIEHAARLERLHHGLEEDLALGRKLAAERLTLAKRLDELSQRTATLDEEQAALDRAADVLRSAEERQQAFAQAFETDQHTAIYGAVGPVDAPVASDGFAALRGRLPFPIAGRSEIQPAHRAGAEGPGLEMRAPLGTVVRTVAPGRVAFADRYADYGKTVIIDHGRRYYTVSANLASIDVEVGSELGSGARLGTVGDSGSGPRLYFELRVEKTTVDPAAWFGI
jgi:septal ring factor EnvC (AmiA/AmiB activator)